MKLEVPESNIEIFGVKETHEMTVKQTDKLFRMMVDGLYKDKYGSVVRELSSNAIDAHVSAGIPDVPFEINLPTEFAGKFSIRDFGNGLCKEDIIKYFGKLLESSKEDDNSAHGAFGIGCKSPFAVVDDFMVISINKGIKTGVTFIRENKGVPKFFITSETETDEQSGTIIIIDDRNTNKWKDAVRSQLAGLSVKPIVNCEIDYPDIKYYNNIGFVNMKILEKEDVNKMYEELKNTKTIIFDIRNYPKGTAKSIMNLLSNKPNQFCDIIKPDLSYPGKFQYEDSKNFILGNKENNSPYQGKIIILVNETTQSHAEFSTMILQTFPNSKVIGSQTSGADGNVSKFNLAGKPTVFTGLGVFYPDGKETQRIGIVPDIEVKPTVKGLQENRDEVLERALEYIKNGK